MLILLSPLKSSDSQRPQKSKDSAQTYEVFYIKNQNLPKLSLSKAGKKQPQGLKDSKKSIYVSHICPLGEVAQYISDGRSTSK